MSGVYNFQFANHVYKETYKQGFPNPMSSWGDREQVMRGDR